MLLLSIILTTGFFATLAMTFFSYTTSRIFKHNFREPELLNLLLDRLPKANLNISKEHVIGWAIHISIGCLFVYIFLQMDKLYTINFTWITGLLFGTIAGTFGAVVWRIFYALHPCPPKTKKWQFLIHLIFAHIVFGLVMIWCLNLLRP